MTSIIRFLRPRRREDAEFSALVAPHVQAMYRMAYRWTQNREDAEDLVQDVLIKVVNLLDELRSKDKPGPWLIKVLYHRYVDLYRRQKSSRIDDSQDAEEVMESLAGTIGSAADNKAETLVVQQQLARALELLEPFQRDIVLMHDVEGYTALEVSEILEINVGTVKSRLHRARATLREALEKGTF